MNQMIVAVFDNERMALEGLRELRNLHKEGGISLYASALIVKGKDGILRVKQQSDPTLGTAVGLLTGGLVGALGGPAGSAVGASLGSCVGLLADWTGTGVNLKFLDDVGKTLTAGKAAVLAEIEESWSSLLDERMRKHGGTVYRRFRVDIIDDQLVREGVALEANLNALQQELDRSIAQDRAAIQKDIRQVRKQLKSTQEQASTRLKHANTEMSARIKALQEQAKGAGGEAKARIKKRIADARADFNARSKKLGQALKLVKEALAA